MKTRFVFVLLFYHLSQFALCPPGYFLAIFLSWGAALDHGEALHSSFEGCFCPGCDTDLCLCPLHTSILKIWLSCEKIWVFLKDTLVLAMGEEVQERSKKEKKKNLSQTCLTSIFSCGFPRGLWNISVPSGAAAPALAVISHQQLCLKTWNWAFGTWRNRI